MMSQCLYHLCVGHFWMRCHSQMCSPYACFSIGKFKSCEASDKRAVCGLPYSVGGAAAPCSVRALFNELTFAVHAQATQGCQAEHSHLHLPHPQQQRPSRCQRHSQHSGC